MGTKHSCSRAALPGSADTGSAGSKCKQAVDTYGRACLWQCRAQCAGRFERRLDCNWNYLSDEEGVQAIMVKVDADGHFEWQHVYEKGYERIWSVAEIADGYILPNDIGSAAGEQPVLTRISEDGEPVEQIRLQPGVGQPHSYLYVSQVAAGMDGGFIAGLRTGQSQLGLVKVSADGKAEWQRQYAPQFSRAFFQIETGDVMEWVSRVIKQRLRQSCLGSCREAFWSSCGIRNEQGTR
ncbi:hypothetical protein DUZ99_14070 [Xylanibacillus composti]|nr:hypothetical protein [Xylanibacillus composti]